MKGVFRDWGLVDSTRPVQKKTIDDTGWIKQAEELRTLLFRQAGAISSPNNLKELVIVPDGMLWYFPFEVLGAQDQHLDDSWLAQTPIRYVPYAGCIMHDGRSRSRQPITLVSLGRLHPTDEPHVSSDAYFDLSHSIPDSLPVTTDRTIPGSFDCVSSLFQQLIVLDDLATPSEGKLDGKLMPALDQSVDNSVYGLIQLPWNGLQSIVLPGYHTAAEDGLSGNSRNFLGNDLFIPISGMLASGTQTVAISRWRMGGQNTINLLRELMQELPYSSTSEAWRRSVLLSWQNPLDPILEPRLQVPSLNDELLPIHPVFWSGIQVIDLGEAAPAEDQMPLAGESKLEERRRLLEEARKAAGQ
ncbi:Hypothetical protein PBC10988_8530 [Planctomycetales bacterium 10988]|nr:Hypothetical protein PBC10988_8530 [Planctomycetales bacterium 10988]